MRKHELKTWPEPFQGLLYGRKTFEVRVNNRGFAVGDVLVLREWDQHIDPRDGEPSGYTGRVLRRRVTYVLRGFGLKDGYVCMAVVPEAEETKP